MYDLFDLFAPRVYVVSEKHYEEALKAKKDSRRKALEADREMLLKRVTEVEEELRGLE